MIFKNCFSINESAANSFHYWTLQASVFSFSVTEYDGIMVYEGPELNQTIAFTSSAPETWCEYQK